MVYSSIYLLSMRVESWVFVLGGLISDEEKVSESGVPVLKDIPVLGWFFSSEKTVHQQKELRVVIKTTVL